MNKTIIAVGITLVDLGIGFNVSKSIESTMHEVSQTGGYLWIITSTATSTFGLKIKKIPLNANSQRAGVL